MKYISLDLETTSLNKRIPENILQISFVVEDTNITKDLPLSKLPHYTAIIHRNELSGDLFAIHMNNWILTEMLNFQQSKPTKYRVGKQDQIFNEAEIFVRTHMVGAKTINVAGQNVGTYDMQFLPPNLAKLFHFRTMENGSIFMNWQKGASSMPEIKQSLGFNDPVAHDAYIDAKDVIRCMRTRYGGNTNDV